MIISCPPFIDVETEGQKGPVWSLRPWKWSHDPSPPQPCWLIRCARTTLNPEQAPPRLKLGPSSPWLYRMLSAPGGCGSQGKCQLAGQESVNTTPRSRLGVGMEGGVMCFVPVDPQQVKEEDWTEQKVLSDRRKRKRKSLEAGTKSLFSGE